MKLLKIMLTALLGLAPTLCAAQTGHDVGIPSGIIVFIDSGSCPSGFTEVAGLNGVYILGTLAANNDAGGTGGSNSYTPAGSLTAPTVNSLTAAAQTVNSLTAAAQGFTGDTTTVPAETVDSLTAAAQAFSGDSTTVPAETVNSLDRKSVV